MENDVINFFTSQKGLSSLGLVIDIIAALLIWKFGIPAVADRDGGDTLAITVPDTEERKERHQSLVFLYDLASGAGIWLLILGFSLQLVANWLS